MVSENTIQQNLVKLLQAAGRHDICWFAVPNGEQRSAKTGARLKAQGVQPGVADLIFVIAQRPIALELKVEKGKQSLRQAEWQEEFERAGGVYYLAKGFDEAVSVLRRIKAI